MPCDDGATFGLVPASVVAVDRDGQIISPAVSFVLVDRAYVAESIRDPGAKITKGYGPVSLMTPAFGDWDDKKIDAIIELLKSVK